MAEAPRQDLPSIYKQRYAPLGLKEWSYKEFPKQVVDPVTKRAVRVLNTDEELKVLSGAGVLREADELATLIVEARNKGVVIDNSWPIERIREEIEEHDAAVRLAKASIAARKAQREAAAVNALTGASPAPAAPSAPAVEPDDAEKARLIALAEANSVKIDKRWGEDKIVAALREAGIDEAA